MPPGLEQLGSPDCKGAGRVSRAFPGTTIECWLDPATLAYHSRAAALFRASQIATHSPSDKTNITINEAALPSRAWEARAPRDRTSCRSDAGQAPSNKIRRWARVIRFPVCPISS